MSGAESEPPDNLLPVSQAEPVLEIDVSSVPSFSKHRRVTHGPVVISLDTQFGVGREPLGEAPQQVSTGNVVSRRNYRRKRECGRRNRVNFRFPPGVDVALEGNR